MSELSRITQRHSHHFFGGPLNGQSVDVDTHARLFIVPDGMATEDPYVYERIGPREFAYVGRQRDQA